MPNKEYVTGSSLGDYIKKTSSNKEFQDTKNILTEIELSNARETGKFYKDNAEGIKNIRENFYELDSSKYYTPDELEAHFGLPFSKLEFLLDYEHLKLSKRQKKKNEPAEEYIESYRVVDRRGAI